MGSIAEVTGAVNVANADSCLLYYLQSIVVIKYQLYKNSREFWNRI